MALSPIGTISALAAVLEHFRPSKSPYLLVIIAGIGGVLIACSPFIDQERFYWIAIPIYIVLVFLTHYSLISVDSNGETLTKSEVVGQLKFSRSVCVISGIGCLVFAGFNEIESDRFALIYISSMVQTIVFVVYTAARVRKEEPVTSANHFQIALVTSAYLIGTTSCIYLMDSWGFETYSAGNGDDNLGEIIRIDKYFLSAILFFVCWGWCQLYWVRRLREIIQISVAE